jgi:branched-chain amino acid transport system substrate-binding protein
MSSRTLKLLAATGAFALVIAVASGFRDGAERGGLTKGTISVGFGNNLTGFLAVHDHLISQGAQLAVRQINENGGIGGRVRIKLALKDVKSDPATSVEVANELIGAHVAAMILPCNTDFQVAMAAVAKRANQFTLSPCNADPTAWHKFPIYWPVGMAGNAQMAQLADYAQSAGLKKIYVLDSNFLYIHLMAKYFKKSAPLYGLRVVGSASVPFGATGFPNDYSAFVDKIKAAKPQAVMTGLFTPYVDTLTKQLRSAGVKVPVLGSDGMDTGLDLTAGGTAVNGNVFTTFGFPTPGSPTAKFYSDYAKRFGKRPDGSYAALGYETVKVLEAAVLRANSTDPKKIQAALGAGMTVNGALGQIVFPGHGEHNPTNPVAVVAIKNRKFSLVKIGVPTRKPAP